MLTVGIIGVKGQDSKKIENYIERTSIGRVLLRVQDTPLAGSATFGEIAELKPNMLFVHIGPHNLENAMRAMTCFTKELPNSAVIAVGDAKDTQNVIASMRAGAREFLETPVTDAVLHETLPRIAQQLEAAGSIKSVKHGKVNAVLSARGGAGATTFAVNLALYLQENSGSTAIVDLATRGHVALHLNVLPKYSAFDALGAVERLDRSLLESYLNDGPKNLKVLAGLMLAPVAEYPSRSVELLMDLLARAHSNVVLDLSSRTDALAQSVCAAADKIFILSQPDKASLWSANQLVNSMSPEQVAKTSVILNRCDRSGTYSDTEIETALGAKIAAKLPGNYPAASRAVDRGVPVLASKNELAGAFTQEMRALLHSADAQRGLTLQSFAMAR